MVHNVVIVTDRFRLPSSNTVQMLEAPPLGLIPVKNIPICSSGRSGNKTYPMTKLNWKLNKIRVIGNVDDKKSSKMYDCVTSLACLVFNKRRFTNGMIRNWQKKPMAGPIGFFNVLRHTSQSIAQPKLIYRIDTSTATLIVNMVSITRSCRITVITETFSSGSPIILLSFLF